MKNFFNPRPATLEDLKTAYHKLIMQYHPDRGGSEEDAKQLNAEYDELFEQLKNTHKSASGETYTKAETETAERSEDFREVLDKIITLNLTIEICGAWIWASGNTYIYRDILKAAGFSWSKSKKAWYWKSPDSVSRARRHYSMEEIRDLHGSDVVKTSRPPQLSARPQLVPII